MAVVSAEIWPQWGEVDEEGTHERGNSMHAQNDRGTERAIVFGVDARMASADLPSPGIAYDQPIE
ncbi:MAG: hypothetical protein MN733_30300 [Nitrososphaera sp.]|nr:hypothetical protein [Nitrososphaera sp.]